MSYSADFLSSQSGIITLEVPDVEGGSPASIKGILQEDPQIQMGNNWGTISEFDDLLNPFRDIDQVLNRDTVTNYVSASGMAWKGTPHMKVNVNFYLISFNANSDIRYKAKLLSRLCALHPTGEMSVKVHGGYKLDYFNNNKSLTDMKDITTKEQSKGTVKITINKQSHTVISGLLTQSLNIQPSTVSVRDGSPLYYVVSAGFTGYRAPIISDLDEMYGG